MITNDREESGETLVDGEQRLFGDRIRGLAFNVFLVVYRRVLVAKKIRFVLVSSGEVYTETKFNTLKTAMGRAE